MTERDYGFGDFNNINLGNVEREISEDADGLRVLQDAALKRFKTNSLEGLCLSFKIRGTLCFYLCLCLLLLKTT